MPTTCCHAMLVVFVVVGWVRCCLVCTPIRGTQYWQPRARRQVARTFAHAFCICHNLCNSAQCSGNLTPLRPIGEFGLIDQQTCNRRCRYRRRCRHRGRQQLCGNRSPPCGATPQTGPYIDVGASGVSPPCLAYVAAENYAIASCVWNANGDYATTLSCGIVGATFVLGRAPNMSVQCCRQPEQLRA